LVTRQTRVGTVSYGFGPSTLAHRRVSVPMHVSSVGDVMEDLLRTISDIVHWLMQPHVLAAIKNIVKIIRRILFKI